MSLQARSSVGKWGGSLGVRIPRKIVESLGVKEGDVLELSVNGGVLSARKVRTYRTLEEIFGDYAGDDKPEYVDFGAAMGEEVEL